ncbi:hypothetical protein LTS15_001108 [Exophiala xenobiotica]|nr:hypothetical protein LTS15_001108 [Exophiala xenobiotica]
MARRSDWDNVHGFSTEEDDDFDETFDKAVFDLDHNRDHEHTQYYEAQERAKELYDEYSDDEPDEDDLDALHAHADLGERARAAASDVAEQRYTWHGRFDEQDHPGHEEQAEEWANRATNIWKDRYLRSLEEEHDRIDRRHAYGEQMLLGYDCDDQEDGESESDDDDDDAPDEETLRRMYGYEYDD